MTIASNIVVEWLRSLHLGEYAESFLDNGYDDLEICKQISEPDLDAIGVLKQSHRLRLLQSVKRLREEGAASVYFSLEESSACLCEDLDAAAASPGGYQQCELAGTQQSPCAASKFVDEYEEGKAELVRIPRMQLRLLLQDRLRCDGIRLACQPYTTPEGERGYLEGLASRYADLLRTHYNDVLEPLEELRRREINASPKIPNVAPGVSQPVYVPGKYSPSSCLSDREEDEIYGFGYGVFSRQMLQRQQQKLALTKNATLSTKTVQHKQPPVYQSCLSPRSAFFYEFPPNEQGQNTNKKKMTISRILRGFKTHKKEKPSQVQESPRHNLKLGIPQRLRLQEAGRRRERYKREHEEILNDIKQGLMKMGRDNQNHYPRDDTYMYDEEVRYGSAKTLQVAGDVQHWYDEPPYESDPEDFLMNYSNVDINTKAIIENDRYRIETKTCTGAVISLPTAGDISLPKERARKTGSTIRGLIVPQGHNNPPTIIPLTHSRISRDSTEYANSDAQSRSSGEDENEESPRSQSTDYDEHDPVKSKTSKCRLQQHANAKALPTLQNVGPLGKHHCAAEEEKVGVSISNIAGRARTLRQDVQRKISRLRCQRGSMNEAAFPCSASSVESLPSGSGSSSTQALVRAGSNHSSISCEDREPASPQRVEQRFAGVRGAVSSGLCEPTAVLCRAKALVDCLPSPYDKDALPFKKGDVIEVLQMNTSGLWKGRVHNRVGYFKFINVEIMNERVFRRGKWGQKYKQKPGSVPELLQRMNLQEYISVFLLNGYEDLELFRELDPTDLDYLRIHHPEHRAKILTAVQLLHDLQSGSDGDEMNCSSSEDDDLAGISCNISRLSIDKKQRPQQEFENNLNCQPPDNQRVEYRANVPTRLMASSNITSKNNPIDE